MEVNGTTYNDETNPEVVRLLEDVRKMGTRLHIWYGDSKTGRAWGDIVTGRISRSMGPTKIPIIVHNRRSVGGPGLLEHCIVRVETSSGGLLLYQHPTFTPAEN